MLPRAGRYPVAAYRRYSRRLPVTRWRGPSRYSSIHWRSGNSAGRYPWRMAHMGPMVNSAKGKMPRSGRGRDIQIVHIQNRQHTAQRAQKPRPPGCYARFRLPVLRKTQSLTRRRPYRQSPRRKKLRRKTTRLLQIEVIVGKEERRIHDR